MSYHTEIFQNYFEKNSNSDYVKVHNGNQESYIDNFKPHLPPDKNSKILEIGSGAGQLLYYLKMSGYKNIEGVDVGQEQVDFLRRMGIQGSRISSILQYLELKQDYYDLIILNHVIEHFSKDELWANLRAIYNSLKANGRLIFATPNMACLSGLFQRYVDFTHQIGFTERSAHQVMRIAGFKNIMIRGGEIKLKFRPRRISWWVINKLWYIVLGFAYYVEKGTDRPKILSRDLIVIGEK